MMPWLCGDDHIEQDGSISLGLGAVVVGAFRDDEVKRIIGAGADEEPLCLTVVGRPGGGDA